MDKKIAWADSIFCR